MDACRNPNILSMVTRKTRQSKKLLFARYTVWKTCSGERDSDADTVRMIYMAQSTGFIEAVCSQVKAPSHSHVWKMFQ